MHQLAIASSLRGPAPGSSFAKFHVLERKKQRERVVLPDLRRPVNLLLLFELLNVYDSRNYYFEGNMHKVFMMINQQKNVS